MLSLPLTSIDTISRRFVMTRPGNTYVQALSGIESPWYVVLMWKLWYWRRPGHGGQGPRTSPWKITSCHLFPNRKTGTNFPREATHPPPPPPPPPHPPTPPPPPVGVVLIRTRMSDGGILFFIFPFLHVTGLAIILSSADAQADLRLCCLHATKSSFSQQGTYGMG